MRRRQSPNVLLYGFGLALALSLFFNGYLLLSKPERQAYPGATLTATDTTDWPGQLQACERAAQQKDSLIRALERNAVADTAAGRALVNQTNQPGR